ncbi:MAG: hypothetical protein KAU20_02935, partial [Nanoarchaeota archaeon]|nr:hypothetical protein [Nanoarchaeota archaeon]
RGLQFIPVLEYLQMAGRAGRPKFDSQGEAIAVCSSEAEKEKIWQRYILGEPEEIFSKLAVEPVLRTYLLSLIASDFVNSKKDIFSFFNKTFWAYQFEDIERLELIIESMLNLLTEWGFIISSKKDDFQSADKVSDEKYEATLTGKRVAELYIDPLSAYNLTTAIKMTAGKKTEAFSFLQIVSHTLEMMPFLRVRTKEYDDIQEELLKHGDCLLEKEPDIYDIEYGDFLNSIKTALMLNEWVDEKDDEYLLEKYSIRPGELRVKVNIANWLLYATEELARILKFKDIIKETTKLRLRLKHGAKEELLALLKLRDIGRARARKMHNYGIRDIADVKKIDVMSLVQLIGKNTALKVKEQVGEKVKEKIKPTKRKGQLSLGKF